MKIKLDFYFFCKNTSNSRESGVEKISPETKAISARERLGILMTVSSMSLLPRQRSPRLFVTESVFFATAILFVILVWITRYSLF